MTAVLYDFDAFSQVMGSQRGSGVVKMDAASPNRRSRDELDLYLRQLEHGNLESALLQLRANRKSLDSPLLAKLLASAASTLAKTVAIDYAQRTQDFRDMLYGHGRHHQIIWQQTKMASKTENGHFDVHLWPEGRPGLHPSENRGSTAACGKLVDGFQLAQTGAWHGQIDSGRAWDFTICKSCAKQSYDFYETTLLDSCHIFHHDLQDRFDNAVEQGCLIKIKNLLKNTKSSLETQDVVLAGEKVYRKELLLACVEWASSGPEAFDAIIQHGHPVMYAVRRCWQSGYIGLAHELVSKEEWMKLLKGRLPRSPYRDMPLSSYGRPIIPASHYDRSKALISAINELVYRKHFDYQKTYSNITNTLKDNSQW